MKISPPSRVLSEGGLIGEAVVVGDVAECGALVVVAA
jgi:hypothetical protein